MPHFIEGLGNVEECWEAVMLGFVGRDGGFGRL
jgi:hypothetical protein